MHQPIAELLPPILSLIGQSAIVMGSPGPSTMSITAVGAAFGLRKGLAYAGGLIMGTATVLLIVAGGLIGLLNSVPSMAPVLIGASTIYIIWLAWRIGTAAPLAEKAVAGRPPTGGGGFLFAVANPKAYLAIGAVFNGITIVPENAATDAALKIIVLAVMIVFIHLAWLLAGTSFAPILRDPVRSRVTNIVFALALVASVLPNLAGHY
jgi:threonine/homoserine/homoserine lactone efflux protein